MSVSKNNLDQAIVDALDALDDHDYGHEIPAYVVRNLLTALDEARGEAVAFQKAAGLENTPTEFTLPFRQAVEGTGDLAHEWKDKPHRLIFDLCRYIERNDAAPPAALAVPDGYALVPVAELAAALDAVDGVMQDAYNRGHQVCCGQGYSECCGNPIVEWEHADDAIMSGLQPVHATLADLLAAAKRKGVES